MELNKKYVLALDVSTSTIGISLFEDMGAYGQLVDLNHFEPILKPEPDTQLERLMEKADLSVEKLCSEYFSNYNIVKVIVEQPLLNSVTQKIAKLLELFNEYLTSKLKRATNCEVLFITVDEARRYALPELMGKNGKMMSDFPKTIAGLKKKDWSKFLIMYLVSQRYKSIKWLLNNALKVNKKNFDRADSIVAGIGYMVKSGEWKIMGNNQFWSEGNFSYERCVEIIEKNVAYEKFAAKFVDKDKTLTTETKLKVKKKYLIEEFKIQDFLNVEI